MNNNSILNDLVCLISRTFYDSNTALVCDILTKDEDLSFKLRLPIKEVHRVCGKLKSDRETKNEITVTLGGTEKTVPKTYYILDYKSVVEITKWKCLKMSEILGSELKNDIENQGYLCTQCQRVFDMLEVQSMLNFSTHSFDCEFCSIPLEPLTSTQEVSTSANENKHIKFMEQSQPIIDLLKLTENIDINPYFIVIIASIPIDITHIISAKTKQRESSKSKGNYDPKFLDNNRPNLINKIEVNFSKTSKKDLKSESERQKIQNLMPIWHQRSTIKDKIDLRTKRLINSSKTDWLSLILENEKNQNSQENVDAIYNEETIKTFYKEYYNLLNNWAAKNSSEKV